MPGRLSQLSVALTFGVITALWFGSTASAAARKPAALLEQAADAFARASYAEAAKLYDRALAGWADAAPSPEEREARERLALSRYYADQRTAARSAFSVLCSRFVDYALDADRLPPDVIAFAQQIPECARASGGGEVDAATTPGTSSAADEAAESARAHPPGVSGPRQIEPAPLHTSSAGQGADPTGDRSWRWYYLTPLGVGQFLAGSPVRGALFLALELGFVAANVAGFVLLSEQRLETGTVRDLGAANSARLVMNVGFFGIIATAVAALIDGAAFEP